MPTTAASAEAGGKERPPARRRSRYVRDPSAAVLTPASLGLLETVASFRLVSLPQLVRLGGVTPVSVSPTRLSPKATQRAMRALFDAGLVDVIAAPRAALAEPGDANDSSLLFGSAPNVYSPTRAGIKLLDTHGLTDGLDPPPGYGPKNALLLRHELGVRDVRVWLTLAARRSPGQAVKAWHDGPEAVIALGQAQAPKVVRPDAWFVYRLGRQAGREAVLVGLLEFDRATERGERRWAEKVAAYRSLFSGPRLREATGYANGRVLVVCPTARRRERLAALIAELAGPALAGRFWLIERTRLEEPGFAPSAWQRPGSQVLQPLVPASLFSARVTGS